MKKYDCVVIGHYESDFNGFANQCRLLAGETGAYHEAFTNSIRSDGRRITNTELLNAGLTAATGKKWNLNPFDIPHQAVFYLTGFLRMRGFKAGFINRFDPDDNQVADLLSDTKSVAITTTYYITDEPIIRLIRHVRSYGNDVRIIIGGPRIHRIYESLPDRSRLEQHLKVLGADIYVVESQGEETLAEIIRAITDGATDLKGIPNIIYNKESGGMQMTERRTEKNDLNRHPIQWRLFEREEYVPTVSLRTSRGCPFSCAFCSYPSFAGPYTMTDLDILENQFRYLSEQGVRNIIFTDDTLNVPLPRFKELLRRMIKNRLGFRWVSYFRCSQSDEETYDLMAESGCIGVYMGIESADRELLDKMNKHTKPEKYEYAIRGLLKRGIMTTASLIVGFPGENEQSVKKTLALLQETGTTFYILQLFFYDSLTPVYQKRREYGLQGHGFGWSHNTMDWKEAVGWKEYIIQNAGNPIILPVFGITVFSLPYFLEQGLSLGQLMKFLSFTSDYLREALDNKNLDISSRMQSLTGLLSEASEES